MINGAPLDLQAIAVGLATEATHANPDPDALSALIADLPGDDIAAVETMAQAFVALARARGPKVLQHIAIEVASAQALIEQYPVPAFDCPECGRSIGATRTHYLIDGAVWCGPCVVAKDRLEEITLYGSRARIAGDLGLPRQTRPSATPAEPYVDGHVCAHCGQRIDVAEGSQPGVGVWVHDRTGRPECDLPADAAPQA